MTAELGRRTVLAGMGAGFGVGLTGLSTLALSACSPSDDITVDAADQVALDQVLAGELALQEQAQTLPGASARQAAAAHRAHADALVSAGGVAAPSTAGSTAGAPSSSGATAASFAAAQRRQADTTARLALGATPRIARLLSSIAASNASFAWLIGATG